MPKQEGSISRAEVGYNERDFRIGVALGCEMTKEAAADFAEVDRSTVYSRLGTNKDFIHFVAAVVKAATSASLAATTEKIKKRYEDMYARAVENLDGFLEDDDPRIKFAATTRVIDQVEGKPKQRIENDTKRTNVNVNATVELPGDVMRFLVSSLQSTQRVLTGGQAPPEDYIDAETIESESGAGGE